MALAAALLLAACGPALGQGEQPAATSLPTVMFGMDAASIGPATSAGAKPDFGTLWVGPWTLTSGWGGPDAQLDQMVRQGVTPAIHFYYWGDDISRRCIEDGCWSSLHKAQKDQTGWQTLADQLVQHLNARLRDKPVLIFLETEFNKGGLEAYEPLDGYLAEKADFLHRGYPPAQVVLALGNWNRAAWGTWDRAAAASDLTGIQALAGSSHESRQAYSRTVEGAMAGLRALHDLFGKPIIITDIALSSHPEPEWLQLQADTLAKFFADLPAMKSLGVQGIAYRSWLDSPSMDLANYYGEAERHWGLAWASNGTRKAAGDVWLDGVASERASAAPAPAQAPAPPTPPAPSPSATPTAGPAVSLGGVSEAPPEASPVLSSDASRDAGPGSAGHTAPSIGSRSTAPTAAEGGPGAAPSTAAWFDGVVAGIGDWWIGAQRVVTDAFASMVATVEAGLGLLAAWEP